MKKLMLLVFLLCSIATIKSANVVATFDFTQADADGKYCGVTIDGFGASYSVMNKTFTAGDCSMTFAGGKSAPYIMQANNDNGDITLVMKDQGIGFTITSNSGAIIKVEFSYFNNNIMDNWEPNVGSFDVTSGSWTGSANSITFTSGSANRTTAINTIKVTTLSSEEYKDVTSVADFGDLVENDYAHFTTSLKCLSQSADRKYTLVSDNSDMMYIYSSSGNLTINNDQVVAGGIKGKKTMTDGIPTIEVEDESYKAISTLSAKTTTIAALSDDNVGKLIKLVGTTITQVSGAFYAKQGDNTIVLKDILLSDIQSTQSGKMAAITGVLGKSGADYVLHPMSIVVTLYSSVESAKRDDVVIVANNGTISINGEWKSTGVYAIDGRTVALNESQVNCGPGIYIVKVDEQTVAKVILK